MFPVNRDKAEKTRVLNVILLKPSKYDDDGYVIRHLRGVLPSNTIARLYSLTEHMNQCIPVQNESAA